MLKIPKHAFKEHHKILEACDLLKVVLLKANTEGDYLPCYALGYEATKHIITPWFNVLGFLDEYVDHNFNKIIDGTAETAISENRIGYLHDW